MTPEHLRYTKDHEWAELNEAGDIRVGITSYAVAQLGDVTLVGLPAQGRKLTQGEAFGEVESVKTVSELFSPVEGEVIATNAVIVDSPEKLNLDAYNDGWLITLRPAQPAQLDTLMTAEEYTTYIEGLD